MAVHAYFEMHSSVLCALKVSAGRTMVEPATMLVLIPFNRKCCEAYVHCGLIHANDHPETME